MIKTRTAKKTDLKYCEKISKTPELQIDFYGNYPNTAYLKEYLGRLFIVAEESGQIVGYVVGERDKSKSVSLVLLIVSSKHRDRGTGKLLINEFIKRAKKMKLKEIITLVPNWNNNTMQFYKKNGFIEMKYYTYFTKEI